MRASDVLCSQGNFIKILEALYNTVLIVDNKKNVVYANANANKIFRVDTSCLGENSNNILGNFINCKNDCTNCLGCELDRSIKNLIKFGKEHEVTKKEMVFFSRIEGQKQFKTSVMKFFHNEKELFFIALDDITEEKKLFKELEMKHYRLQKLSESLENSDSIVMAIANSVEAKDKLTKGHISRVAFYAQKIGEYFKMSESELELLKKGAVLHDIGKIGTPDNILNKPGALTKEEFEIMKNHPVDGWNILSSLKSFKNLAKIARHHHEKLDGTGYPDGLKDEEIDIYTRIVAIVDIFDALTADRSYRSALTREQALNIIFEDVKKGKLDSKIANALKEITAKETFPFASSAKQKFSK